MSPMVSTTPFVPSISIELYLIPAIQTSCQSKDGTIFRESHIARTQLQLGSNRILPGRSQKSDVIDATHLVMLLLHATHLLEQLKEAVSAESRNGVVSIVGTGTGSAIVPGRPNFISFDVTEVFFLSMIVAYGYIINEVSGDKVLVMLTMGAFKPLLARERGKQLSNASRVLFPGFVFGSLFQLFLVERLANACASYILCPQNRTFYKLRDSAFRTTYRNADTMFKVHMVYMFWLGILQAEEHYP